jgi:O-acetyl-ADP-ribose deacetylase (regulator of RNase III)
MGQIQYIKGNLFANTNDRKIIAHGVNCRGGFGSGIAGQIAQIYPMVRMAYLSKYNHEGWELGEIQVVPVNGRVIVNLATQDTYGRNGVHVNYEACFEAFKKLFRYAEMHTADISMPKISSGLAGGEWNLVEKQLLNALKGHEVSVDVYYL